MHIETGLNNDILRQKSEPVQKVDKSILKLITEMEQTMLDENGIGLAAPQVGVHKRVMLVAVLDDQEEVIERIMPMINPEILQYSAEEVVMEEGCLSLPEKFAKVRRPAEVKVKYTNPRGDERTMMFDGLTARIIQHEYDHLEGILFPDRIEGGIKNITEREQDHPLV